MRGAVRGLVVSPWFAAGAGFVVAAGAFMYAPHAQLSPGNPLIGRTPCKAHGCKSTTEQGAKPLNAAAGQLPASPSPSPSTPPTTGLTFKYAVSWHTHDTFEMVLIVAGKKAIGDWRLTFTIQGATKITSVLGADWQPSGTGGVVATGATYGGSQDASVPSSGSPSARPTSGDDNYSDAGARSPDVIYLVVDGSGTPKAPDDCFFDGSACQFAQMTSP